jgi:subtilase family serine protease
MTAANGGPLGQTSQNLGAIQPGLTTMVTIPLGSLPGGTYVTARVDASNSVAESNEGNNAQTIVLPNLPF